MLSFLFTADEDGVHNKAWGDIKIWIEWLLDAIDDYKASLNGAKPSISNFITSLKQSKVNAEAAGEATEGFSLKLLTLRARALLLNAALGVGIGLLVSWGTKKITEAAQRVQNVATQSKEAADAAQSTTSSLKDLVSAYEELGDKSGWDTDDFDQAKDIQAEILDLAKEQGTLDEDKLGSIDLQNGKYQEQLGLLQDITAEQLEASRYELTQNKDAQGDKLVDTAKKNNRTHYLTVWSAPEMDMGDQIKNAGIDIFNKFGGYGPDKLNDADSIVDYYNEVGKALKYVIDNTTEAERAAGGTYHSLYQFLLDEQNALRDDVDSYNDSTDAINNNTNARRKLQAVDFWQNDNNNSMDVSFTFDKVNSAVQTLKDTIDGFDASKLNDLLWGTNEGLSDEQTQALASLRKALTDMDFSADTNGVNAFIQALVQIGIVAQSSANGINALAAGAQKMEDISSKMDEIQSAYKASTSAMEEYNQYGYMSLDSLQSLLTMNSEYLNCLELVDGKLQVNKQSYAELLAAQYAEAAATILSNAQLEVAQLTADDTSDSTDDLKEKTEAEKTALENLLPALKNATAATATYSAAQEFANEVEKASERGVDPAKLEEITNRTNTQLSLLYTNMNAALKGGQELANQLNGFPTDKTNKNNKSTAQSVTDIASAFDTLTKAMKEYNQYGYICADTMKSLIGVDDKFTACLTEQDGKLELNTARFRTFIKAQLEEANAANDSGKSAGEMKKILDWLNSSVDSETISFEQLTDAIKGYGTAMDEAKEKTDAIKSAFSSLSEVSKNKIDSPFGALDSDDVEKQYQAIRDLYDNTDLFTDDRFAGALNPETGLIDYNSDAFKQMFLEKLDSMATACEETGGKAGKYLAQGFRDAEDKIKTNVISIEEYINGLGSTLENINNRMDNFQSAFNDLSDIVDEYNTYGDLSQDSIQKLMGLDVKYTACLDLQGDKLVFNKEAFRALYVAQLQKLAADYEGTEIGKRYAEILQKIADGTWDVTDHMKGMGTEVEKLKSGLSDLKDIFSSMLSLFEKFNTDKDNDLKLWGEAMTEDIDKRIEALNKQKEALEKANDEEERAITLAKLKAELEKARTQRTVRKLTSNGYEWVADESAVKEAKDNLSDQQREWRKEDAEKAIDDQIDKLNELKDKYSEAMNLIGTSLDDYNKKLRYAAQIQDMTFSEMEGRVDEYKNKIIASFTNAAPVSGIQNLISNIESLINTLTKLNNVYSWIQTGEYQDKGTKGLWNTIKGFFSKGGTETTDVGNFEKSYIDVINAAKKAASTVKNTATETGNALKNILTKSNKDIAKQVVSSGSKIVDAFGGIWDKIKLGAQNLFSGSGGNGIISTIANGIKTIGSIVKNGKIGSAIISGGSKLLAGAGGLIKGAGAVLASAGSMAIPIASAVGLGIYNGINSMKHQKEIWSNKEDSFGKKALKSVASFFWDISPIGGIVNLCKGIFGKNKEIADNTKDNGKDNTSSGTTNNSEGIVIGNIKGKKAGGSRSIKQSGRYNVDEFGPELIVRQPTSGRYTYLETGDGVVPADITSRLFDMGGNPDRWFTEQMERNAGISNVQNRTIEGDKITIGDIYIQNPVGGVDDLAREINQRMPAMYKQIQSKR